MDAQSLALPFAVQPSSEDVLCYAWKTLRFRRGGLVSVCGQAVEVLRPGIPNLDTGPDFLQAGIRIGGTQWAGAVEMHLRGADWYTHNHHTDPAYNAVVLHVVWHPSPTPPIRQDGTEIPELCLAGAIDPALLAQAEALAHAPEELPCAGRAGQVPMLFRQQWVEHCGWQRIQHRVAEAEEHLAAIKFDWIQLAWERLAPALGGPVNKEAMARLARRLPIARLAPHRDDLDVLEALLFGTAGLLPAQAPDAYTQGLQQHWQHYSRKYALEPLPEGTFRFGKMRPAGFPTVRLAQLAALLHLCPPLLELVARPAQLQDRVGLLVPSAYWYTHYRFGTETKPLAKPVGKAFVEGLLINCFVPLSVLYHKTIGQRDVMEAHLELLQRLAPEDNATVRLMAAAALPSHSALETQGLLHLHRHWCQPRRCLNCGVGHKLVSANLLPDA